MISPLPSTSTLPRMSSGLDENKQKSADIQRVQLSFVTPNIPRNAPKVRRIPLIAQMDPAAHTRSSGTALGTRTPRTSPGVPCVPCLYKCKPSRGGKCLGLALQPRVVGGVFREHIVEDGEEARVALERIWCWRIGRCGANRE